jgi:hypothetical protein
MPGTQLDDRASSSRGVTNGGSPSHPSGSQSYAPSSLRRRRALLPFENSECDSRAEGIFALVKRRTPQSPDDYLSRVTLSSCRGLQSRRRTISSRQKSYLLFAKVYLRVCVTLQARTHRDETHPSHHHATITTPDALKERCRNGSLKPR